MIKSKNDYLFYLEADRIALGKDIKNPSFFGDEVWKFQRLLRKNEYLFNCKKDLVSRLKLLIVKWQYHRLSVKLGFRISRNNFGPGLSIAHPGTIIVNRAARIGANCRLHTCTNIGTQAGYRNKAPKIGNNVFIGPGAKMFGDIEVADNICIGANSVVNKSFKEPSITIAGVPAKKISNKDSTGILVKATEILLAKLSKSR